MSQPSTPDAAGALRLDALCVRFGGILAVDHVSLAVQPGQRWAVIGPNGAGKTTLFRSISGEVYPTSGSVSLFGRDVTRTPPYRRARAGIGRTYQVTTLFPQLTAEQNVAVAACGTTRSRLRAWAPMRMRGELRERVTDSLGQVGLLARRQDEVRQLSHGEQRQLELAMALAGRPRLLLLDEPGAGLASSERKTMGTLVERLPDDLTVVLIEHDMSLALDLTERVLCLDDGRMVAEGTPEQIRAHEGVQAAYLRVD